MSTLKIDEVIINGSKTKAITICPTADNEYAPVKWEDQDGNNVAMIVAHENTTDGRPHNHWSLYTCMEDRSKRLGRIDLEFGKDFANLSFEDLYLTFQKGAYLKPVLKSSDGKLWRVHVNNDGKLYTSEVI